MGAALVSVAYFNWRYDWNYRYGKWLRATLFGASRLRKPFDQLAEAKLMRGFYREFSSGFLLLLGGIFLILGFSLIGR
jgi:hypothetical protein